MLSFASATGNLFNRLGKLGLLIKQARTFQTSQLTNLTDSSTGAVAQFNGESDLQALIGSSYISLLSGPESSCTTAQSVAVQTLSRMVYRDNPQISQSLQSVNTTASLQEVIRQMKLQGASVLAMSVAATPGTFSSTVTNVGNGAIVASVKRPFDGVVLENTFGETVKFTCSSDSYSSVATAGNEGFSLTGTGSQSDVFAFNWPLGSGASTSLSAIDGSVNNTSGNILTNSGFDAWTSNVPDNWSLTVGAGGANLFQETSILFGGAGSLRLAGDASNTLTSWRQQFNVSTGTAGTLSPQTQYSWNIWACRDGTAAAAGVLTIELIDSNLAVIKDANGVANSTTIDLTALTTVFQPFGIAFRTPIIMPTTYYIRLRLSTALTNGRSVYLDLGGLGQMTQHYVGGPYYGVHAGSVPFQVGDYATAVITNSRGSGSTLSTWQTIMFQLYFSEISSNEFLFPSSATPSIADALIG